MTNIKISYKDSDGTKDLREIPEGQWFTGVLGNYGDECNKGVFLRAYNVLIFFEEEPRGASPATWESVEDIERIIEHYQPLGEVTINVNR